MSALHLKLVSDDVGADATPQSGSLRIAIATQDMKSLNAHFGSARRFVVYDVSPDEWTFVEAVSFDDVSDETGKHKVEGDDRITPKIEGLKGCHILFCLAIGGPSAAKVVGAGIHPIKITQPQSIESVLQRTRDMLRGSPPPWLRKIMANAGVHRKPRFFEEA